MGLLDPQMMGLWMSGVGQGLSSRCRRSRAGGITET